MDCDLVVIGGGAGGMSAARAGVRQGKRTVLVQDGPIGGDCTFTGCVPSKALVASAAQGESFASAMQRARDAIKAIAATEDAAVFRGEGVDVVEGRARFVSANEIEVDGRRIGADRFIVATGAVPAIPSIPGLRESTPLTSDNLWERNEPPASIAVLGGGAIGCELAQAMARLGVETTLVEAQDRLLSTAEPEASAAALAALGAAGVDVHLGAEVTGVDRDAGGVNLTLAGAPAVSASEVLVAVGRRPVVDGLEPSVADVALDDRGFIATDDHLRTTASHIYAVGDVTGKVQLTHAADEMGRIAAGNAFSQFRLRRFRPGRVPSVTFIDPEIASVGLSENEAARLDPGAQVAELPMTAVDRAVVEHRTEGFVKVICGRRALLGQAAGGRVLGATVVGPRAGELIHAFALAMCSGMFPARLATTVHVYPTWSVAVRQVMAQFFVEVEGRRARPARAA